MLVDGHVVMERMVCAISGSRATLREHAEDVASAFYCSFSGTKMIWMVVYCLGSNGGDFHKQRELLEFSKIRLFNK